MPASNVGLLNRKQAIRKGVSLGMFGAFIVCTLSIVIFACFMLIVGGSKVFSEYMAGAVLILVGPAPFVVTVLPAGLAGGIDALVLYNLARKAKLQVSTGLRTGSLIGLVAGVVIAGILFANDILDNRYVVTSAADLLVYGIPLAASALVGLWHGWRMVRYLQRCGR